MVEAGVGVKPSQVKVGVNYFGRAVTSVDVLSGVVFYTNFKGEHLCDFLGAFCSWVVVQQGGEPTDPWHAMCMKIEAKGQCSLKRVKVGGKFYRMRRGKLVEIPEEWVGKVTHRQTVRKRPSKKCQGRRFKRKAMR